MFKPVSNKLNQLQLEENQLKFWKAEEIFKKSSDERKDRKPFVFYEGPPTANGKPGIHHVIGRVYKDMFLRFRVMQGYYVDRRGGWDTHGLPVEIEVEKKLGFDHKSQIEEYGIGPFNELCRESAFARIQDWERMTERIAYWVDFDRAYVTYKNEYIESVWWLLRQIWDKDLLYQGYKVVPYCPRCGTPLSDHEVALGYQDAEDPSVYVRFPLRDEPGTYFLVWTTTPWTLPANAAIAAHPDVDYVTVQREDGSNDEKLILAKDLVPVIFGDIAMKVLKTVKGKQLAGLRYNPLYNFFPSEKPAHFIVNADYVTTSDGTGLVHTAPSFGAEDMETGKLHDLPVIQTLDDSGQFKRQVTPWAGMFVKDADPLITKELDERGLLFRSGKITHTYPFCWRCDTPLLYQARPSWFIRTTAVRDRMVELNKTINWVPEHIRSGRFGNWLENNVDWALGRNRYWGTPLPVWECASCGHQHCIGSVAELSELAGRDLSELDLHRPYVDDVHFACPICSRGTMKRVPELIDVWFDSGAMPSAQWHYPFENQEEFHRQHPADYISEAIDQTRGWFYSLHAVSTLVFDDLAFKNVICYGHILDPEGKKMSKHKGNVIDPWTVLDEHGADPVRWYMLTASPPQNERRFGSDLVGEVTRTFMLPLWNTYSFFVTYANLDGWDPFAPLVPRFSEMDRWLLSALNVLVRDVTKAYESYDVVGATRPISSFVDQLSNWWLRRSRRRFWKSDADADKSAAYETLYTALVTVSKLLAPAAPFMAEEIYQNLVRGADNTAPISVHLADWPLEKPELVDEGLNREMDTVMRLASLGHAARNKSNIKVRQPVSEVAFAVGFAEEAETVNRFKEVLEDELNVKHARLLAAGEEAVEYTINPLPRQLGQRFKGDYPKVRQAIMELPEKDSALKLLEGLNLVVQLDGKYHEILPEEVEVHSHAQEGYEVAAEGAYLAALVTKLTPDLVNEGLAREFVRRVQALRKDSGLDISDRIRVRYLASPQLAEALQQNREYIMSEVLAVEMEPGEGNFAWFKLEDSIDAETIKVAIEKANAN